MEQNTPIIIIGSGMAGYTFAREFRKLDKEANITMISQNNAENYAKPTLSNALTAKKTPEKIALADATKMADQLNLDIINQCTVTGIDTAKQQIQISKADGETQTLSYASLILAVGANVIKLPIQGDASDSILSVNDLDDYALFRQKLDSDAETPEKKHIAIIGAGLIGCEFANDLINAGHDVSVFDLADSALAAMLPKEASDYFTTKMQEAGVTFYFNTSVTEVNQADAKVSLLTTAGDQINADVVLSAVGLRPNLTLASAADIACDRGILVDNYLQTNMDNVYAIGDCAQVSGFVLPYVMPLMQEAKALAKTLASEKTHVHYPAMPVAVKTPAVPLVILAPADDAVTWQAEETEDGMIWQALDSENQLKGFILLGKTAGKQRMTLAKQVPDLIAV